MRARLLVVASILALSGTACSANDSATQDATSTPAQDSSAASDSGSTESADSPASADVCQGVTLEFLGLDGEQGTEELADWRTEHGVEIQTNNTTDWSNSIAAIQAGQAFDIITLPYDQAQQIVAAKVLRPLDTTAMGNWDRMVAGLQQSPDIRDAAGAIYGAPIAWGDGPFVYNPAAFTPPDKFSILDLLSPEWKNRFSLFDSPGRSMYFIGKALGYKAPMYTKDEFANVVAKVKELVANAAGFTANYKDGTASLVSGDIDLLINGWQSQLPDAAASGTTLAFAYFQEGRTGWWDALAIPTTAAHPECAQVYINQMLAPDVQAQLANNLVSGVTNLDAIPLVTGDTKDFYDYAAVESATTDAFDKMTPPDDVPDGIVPFAEWQEAWQNIKAG